jgi:hypothetical protein
MRCIADGGDPACRRCGRETTLNSDGLCIVCADDAEEGDR